jgi:hypothetical protein
MVQDDSKGVRRLVWVGNAWEAMNWIGLNEWHNGTIRDGGSGSIRSTPLAIVWFGDRFAPKEVCSGSRAGQTRGPEGQEERNAVRVGAKITIQGAKGAGGICYSLAL